MKPTYRKSWAANLLMWSDLTLGPSFKVKRGEPNLKVLITRLLLKNAVFLQNYVSWPFPMDTSCIWPQMRPWSSLDIVKMQIFKGPIFMVFSKSWALLLT